MVHGHRVGPEPAVDFWGWGRWPEDGLLGPAGPVEPMTGVSPGLGVNKALPPCQLQEPSLYTIKAVFILDNDGHRLLAKVTSHPHRRAPEDTATGPHPEVPTQLAGETPLWALRHRPAQLRPFQRSFCPSSCLVRLLAPKGGKGCLFCFYSCCPECLLPILYSGLGPWIPGPPILNK